MKKILFFTLGFSAFTLLKSQVTFTTLSTPTTQHLLGISFSGSLTGYACGNSGTLLKTTNGGATWTTLSAGTNANLWDIKVMPQSQGLKVIAVGENNTIIKSKDGGNTWTAQTVPFQAGSFVFGVQCLDTLNYFACGGDYGTFSGAVLKTTNGGLTWTKTTVSSAIFLDKIFMRNPNYGFCAGSNMSFDDGAVHKTTNATAWTPAKTTSSLLTNVWCSSNTHIVSVGLNGQILRSTNAGATWSNTALNTTDLYGVQFLDSLNGFACGGDTTVNAILTTTNGGLNWSQIQHPFTGQLQSISIGGKSIFIAGYKGTILKGTLPSPTVAVNTGLPGSQLTQEDVDLYPVPAEQSVFLKMPKHSVNQSIFELMDLQGKIIVKTLIRNEITEIDISGIQNGSYFYRVSGTNGTIHGKCIVSH